MSSFFMSAGKKRVDVKTFLREAQGGNSIRYRAEMGKKHNFYVPFSIGTDENGNQTKNLISYSMPVHEWTDANGRYHSCGCLKNVIRYIDDDETKGMINDGTCPFCDNVAEGWEVANYRVDMEMKHAGNRTGKELEKFTSDVKSRCYGERKVKEANEYMYLLVVQFRTDKSGQNLTLGADGVPEYDLRVMRLGTSRLEKIMKQFENSKLEFPGSEFIISYGDEDQLMTAVSQSTITPVYPQSGAIATYPDLLSRIEEDVEKFEWDGIEKAFPELDGMATAAALKIVDDSLEQWRAYKEEKKINPAAVYLEYATASDANGGNPALDASKDYAAYGQMTGMGAMQMGKMPAGQGMAGNPNMMGMQYGMQIPNGGVQLGKNGNVGQVGAQQGAGGFSMGAGAMSVAGQIGAGQTGQTGQEAANTFAGGVGIESMDANSVFEGAKI